MLIIIRDRFLYYLLLVGKPIPVKCIENPTHEEIQDLQNIYIEALQKLYEENRAKYDVNKDLKLIIT